MTDIRTMFTQIRLLLDTMKAVATQINILLNIIKSNDT